MSRKPPADAPVRAVWGTVLLAAPHRVLALAGVDPSGSAVAVTQFLGVRQLLQAGTTVLRPTRSVAGCGALVDLLHAGTTVGLALTSRRWRRAATADTLIATAFVIAGWRSYRLLNRRRG